MNEETIRIEDILDVLAKRWRMIAIITILATILSGIISFWLIPPKYEASTKLFIGKENIQGQDQNYNNNDVQMYQKLLKTYSEIITTNDLVTKAIDEGNLNVQSKEVLDSLKVTPRADTQILEITYTSKDKELSKEVVDLVTDEFIKESAKLIPNGNVKTIESVKVPEAPVSPNKKMNIAIAFLLGLMVSAGLAFLLEFVDNTFKTKEQVEEILGLPVVGAIPDELN